VTDNASLHNGGLGCIWNEHLCADVCLTEIIPQCKWKSWIKREYSPPDCSQR